MKVAHINTHTQGGAAIVATRIHLAEIPDIDSLLVTRYGRPETTPRHHFFKNSKIRDTIRGLSKNPYLRRLAVIGKRLIGDKSLAGRPKGLELFSTLNSSVDARRFDFLEDADIIHLHWVSNFIDYEYFFRRFSHKRFVWTLHDMNPFTGGCHHSDGCLKFQTDCISCPQLKHTQNENLSLEIQNSKIRGLEYLDDNQMIITAPSEWLLTLSRKSRTLGRFKHFVVPNPTFIIHEQMENIKAMKQGLGLPEDKKIILFVSDNLNNDRKGIGFLFETVHAMEHKDILLVGIGHKAKPYKDLDIHYTSKISDVHLLAKYYTCADVFIHPSLAENSPLVIIEALSCGTPVIASDVGGIPELIDDKNGILFKVGNQVELKNAITEVLYNRSYNLNEIKLKTGLIHDLKNISQTLLTVYKDLKN